MDKGQGPDPEDFNGIGRRDFLKMFGASMAAGAVGFTGLDMLKSSSFDDDTEKILKRAGIEDSDINNVTGYASGDSYRTVTVPANKSRLIEVKAGETFNNVLIDISASGADARIMTSGSGWKVKNIGFRGSAPAHTHGGYPNRFQADGTGLVEHVYIGDGVTQDNSRGGCFGVSKSSSGEVTFRECHWGRASDNGIYAASTADGGEAVQHFERCLTRNNNVAHFRIASDGTTVKDCVAYNTNDVHTTSMGGCNCVNSRGAWDGYGSQSDTVTFENVHFDITSSNTNGANSAIVAGHVNYIVKDSQLRGTVEGDVKTENVGSNPSHNAPSGVPMTAVEAANGTSSAEGLPHEVTSGDSAAPSYSSSTSAASTIDVEEHTVKISSSGKPRSYYIEVRGCFTSKADGGADEVFGNKATGRVIDGSDTYKFTGALVDFEAEKGVNIEYDGEAKSVDAMKAMCSNPSRPLNSGSPTGSEPGGFVGTATNIVEENKKDGTQDWVPNAVWFNNLGQQKKVAGYATKDNVKPGEELGFCVRTAPAAEYKIDIYRIGWYGGDGGRKVKTIEHDGPGQPQPIPRSGPGPLDCGWSVTDTVEVTDDWTSGLYYAYFRVTSGPNKGLENPYPFVVQESSPSTDILMQLPTATHQAYNSWGDESLYDFRNNVRTASDKVSFNRPYNSPFMTHMKFAMNMIRWMEKKGYSVSYISDVGAHEEPGVVKEYKMAGALGHAEYWSRRQRQGFREARDSGTNLAFFCGNNMMWVTEYSQGNRVMDSRDRQFRQIGQPEEKLTGVRTARSYLKKFPNLTVVGSSFNHKWFKGTGFRRGGRIQHAVIHEPDQVTGNSPRNIKKFFTHPNCDTTVYKAASGARVFSASTMGWNMLVDPDINWAQGWLYDRWMSRTPNKPDERLQKFTKNVFDDLKSGAA